MSRQQERRQLTLFF